MARNKNASSKSKKKSKKVDLNQELEEAKKIVEQRRLARENAEKCMAEIKKILDKYGMMIHITQPQFTLAPKPNQSIPKE